MSQPTSPEQSGAKDSFTGHDVSCHRAKSGGWGDCTCLHSSGADRWEQRQRANRLLLDHLLTLWDAVPDWRFGQLVMNLSREPGGFADTWEWSHSQWRERIEKEYAAWVK